MWKNVTARRILQDSGPKILVLLVATILSMQMNLNQAEAQPTGYDPELAMDGIPVLSARSRPSQVTERYENHRRRSDPELEDVDDYDDDNERQRGSSSTNHDTYENPGYGESRRSAQDGEDIEKFFDRHIGPESPDAANEAGRGSDPDDREHNSLSSSMSNNKQDQLGSTARSDLDNFEMAASSPLATIFQTLLSAHKRPIVIETDDISATIGSAASAEAGQGDSSSSTSSVQNALGAKQASASTAIQYPTGSASAAYGMSPIATYLSPIAASSSLSNYGQSSEGQDQDQSMAAGGPSAEGSSSSDQEEGGQIQEIYIGRRPAVMGHFQNYSPSKKMSQQSSNAAYWRNQLGSSMPARPYRPSEQMSNAYNSDYARYPVAASYAHQQESNQPGDDGTVEYNLSFGGGAGGSSDESPSGGSNAESGGPMDNEETSSLSVDSQAGPGGDESQPSSNSYGRFRGTSTNQYLSYNAYNQPGAYPMQRMRVQPGRANLHNNNNNNQLQQQQSYQTSRNLHPGRYHKDPSESVIQPINYGQFRTQPNSRKNQYMNQQGPNNLMTNQETRAGPQYGQYQVDSGRGQLADERPGMNNEDRLSDDWHTRQKLLSSLDHEIKSSQLYNRPSSTKSSSSMSVKWPARHSMANPSHQRTPNGFQRIHPTTNVKGGDESQFSNARSETNPSRSFVSGDGSSFVATSQQSPKTTMPTQSGPPNHQESHQITSLKNETNQQQQQQEQQNHQHIDSGSNQKTIQTTLSNDDISFNDSSRKPLVRNKRDDADDRDDNDDDGVWVDDDEDDDNSRQSSDVNETSQDPNDDSVVNFNRDYDQSGQTYNAHPIMVSRGLLNH